MFGTCVFYAIKWHRDKGKKAKKKPADGQCRLKRTPSASE